MSNSITIATLAMLSYCSICSGQSALDINSFAVAPDNSTVNLEWSGDYGHLCFVQSSNDLFNWKYETILVLNEDSRSSAQLEMVGNQGFFKVIQIPYTSVEDPKNADLDGDTLTTWDELLTGLDPLVNLDANGNNLPDDWEYFYSIEDPQADVDGDGKTAEEEYLLGTSPRHFYHSGSSFVIEEFKSDESDAMCVRVLDSPSGQPVPNAPVGFKAILGGHGLSKTRNGAAFPEITVYTNDFGIATIYIKN